MFEPPHSMAKMRRAVKNDVAIIGGGPSGLSLAASLGAAGLSVVCLEREAIRKKSRPDGRTTALSYRSQKILKSSGVWPRLEKQACPILDIRVADQHAPLYLDFHHHEVGNSPFGWIVENRIFHKALNQRVRELKNVHVIEATAVQKIENDGHQARIILNDGQIICSALVVGADGRRSICREQANIPVYGWNYGQTAIVCTIEHSAPHHNVAVEHFLPGGPLATLPMLNQRSSIVWTEKAAVADYIMKMEEAEFTAELEEKVLSWLGHIKLASQRFAYPLNLQHARRYTAPRIALIGDAAHGIHPIAGQGFNLGMGDIEVLTDEIIRATRLGLDVGDPSILLNYERRRKFDNGNMVLVTDILDRLFSNAIPPVQAARRLGLGMVQKIPPLRKFFMRVAMGETA